MSTSTLNPSGDLTIYQNAPTLNENTATALYTGLTASSATTRRSLLYFDISALSLSGKVIESAVLSLYQFATAATGHTLRTYKQSHNDWVVTEATWNIYKTGSSWTDTGGDFESTTPTPVDHTVVGGADWIDIDVATFVQDAVDNTTNVNFLIRDTNELTTSTTTYLWSNEHTVAALRPKLVITYFTPVAKTFTDTATAAQVTETYALTSSSFPYELANNNQAYVYNLNNNGWRFQNNFPFTNAIYIPSTQQLIGSRRDLGNISRVNYGDTFDGTDIAAIYRSGFYNLGKIDEMKRLEDDMSEAIKKLRSHHAEVKAGGNLTLTIFTENDSTGKTFTVTPTTADNVTYNQVRTALSRDIHGKYVSFQIENVSGCDFYVGEQRVKIKPRNIR